MRTAIGLVIALVAVPATVRAGWTVGDSAQNLTHDCGKDPEVVVLGSDNTLTLTGTCTKVAVTGSTNKMLIVATTNLSVTGSANTIEVGASDRIAITGTDNKVSYVKGLKRKSPKVSRLGTGNKVTRVKSIATPPPAAAAEPAPPADQPPPPAAGGGGDKVITGKSYQTLSHDCGASGTLRVDISHSKISLTGTCTKLVVAGSNNQINGPTALGIALPGNSNSVKVDVVDEVSILGNSNSLSYRRTSSGKSLKSSNLGKANAIQVAK